MTQVTVIGAAGYVGIELCRELLRRGHQVTAVTRPNGRFLLDRLGVRVEGPEPLTRLVPPEVVINLAYPNRGRVSEYPRRNAELLSMIRHLAGEGARIIHLSTQAVFGYALEYPVVPAPVADRKDYLYVESKIELENLLARVARGNELHIVRMGNVWGPASPGWTAALADKLLFGDVVGVLGADGFSNVTDVGNVVSYVAELVTVPGSSGIQYHHLAEFSDTPWSWWIGRLEARLHVAPVYAAASAFYPSTITEELLASLAIHSPRTMAHQWLAGRFTGSWLRTGVRAMPGWLTSRFGRGEGRPTAGPGRGQPAAPGDAIFLSVMSAKRQFKTVVPAPWTPPVDREAAWQAAARWLDHAGY